jgi:hypothetical protein
MSKRRWISRRDIILLSASIPAISFATVGTLGGLWYNRPPGDGLRCLSDQEYLFLQAVAEAYLPPGGDPALSGAEANLGAFFDEILVGLHIDSQNELKLLLQVLDDLAIPTRYSAFHKLPLAERTDQLKDWLNSDVWLIRSAIQGVLVLLNFGWTTHPDVVHIYQELFGCHYGR